MSSPSRPFSADRGATPRPPCARRYAKGLLNAFSGTPSDALSEDPSETAHDALSWARSGAMHLTGERAGPPRLAPAAFATACEGAAMALEALGGPHLADPASLLGERAALLGLSRRGPISPGGHCRIMAARDGWLAISLAREDDIRSLPAWLETDCPSDPFPTLAQRLPERDRDTWLARARLMGLPVAPVVSPPLSAPQWFRVENAGRSHPPGTQRQPLVLDFSSLWAGPLCTQLLAEAGARVIKIESPVRPDGARRGPAAFFDLLNAGKESVALDLTQREDRLGLTRLLDAADIVVESSRPRALLQLGVDASEWLAERPGRTWLSITGYGRAEPMRNWVAFGDDAAVAAGTALAMSPTTPIFVADAIADPLTGLHAAVAARAAFLAGGGKLLDLSLCNVVASILATLPASPARVQPADGSDGFCVTAAGQSASVERPRARTARGRAPGLGVDTQSVLESTFTC